MIKYKFGVRIPKDYNEALRFNKENNNILWQDATRTELDQIIAEYKLFVTLENIR